jgi:Ca-activated chloride channel family protein
MTKLGFKRITLMTFALLLAWGCAAGEDGDDDSSADGGGSSASGPSPTGAGGTGGSPSYYGAEQEPPWYPDVQYAAEAGAGGAGGESYAIAAQAGTGGAAGAGGAWIDPVQPPDANQGDMYEAPGTNPFVLTAHDPFSTFAADVDTASYDIFRRDVQNGMLPQPASVRLEEYVNYFLYDYPVPDEQSEHPFTISLGAAPSIADNGTALLRVGIQAQQKDKPRANLVFLVDSSGSMSSSNKLPLVQYLLTQTLEILDPEDTVSLVTYASGTGVRLEPTPVSQSGTIAAAINQLTAGGSTAGAAGIDLAYQQAEAAFIEGGINHVILCTDGDFNVGPYTDEQLVELIEQKRTSGVTLTALGFGIGNLNDSMMEKVTNAGNGVYAMISTPEQAADYVGRRMLGSLVYVAKDMKIQVEFNPDSVYAYRLLGYENRDIADQDFRNDVVDAGEVGSGHRVTALYELVLSGGEIPERQGAPEIDDGEPVDGEREIDPADMVLVKVRYKDVDATAEDPAYEVSATMTDGAIASGYAEADQDFQWAAAVASFAEILKQSPYADPDGIENIEQIVTAQAERDADRGEFEGLFQKAKLLLP